MTRRERHLRILDSFGITHASVSQRWTTMRIPLDWEDITDKGIEAIARKVVSNHRRSQKLAAENRARIAAQSTEGAA